jgi:hypothetical protein
LQWCGAAMSKSVSRREVDGLLNYGFVQRYANVFCKQPQIILKPHPQNITNTARILTLNAMKYFLLFYTFLSFVPLLNQYYPPIFMLFASKKHLLLPFSFDLFANSQDYTFCLW